VDERDEYISSLEFEIRHLGSTLETRATEERRQEFHFYAAVWIAMLAVTGWVTEAKGWDESFGSSTVVRVVGLLLVSFFGAGIPVLVAVLAVGWVFRQTADWWATTRLRWWAR
jgi:hypothetical protein